MGNKAKKIFFSRPIPEACAEGLWINFALFVKWENIEQAKLEWIFGLPCIKLRIKTDSKFVYNKPEVMLFYRDYQELLTEVRAYCPEGNVFYRSLPDQIPKKNFKLYYYSIIAGYILICFLLVFAVTMLFT